RRQLADYIDLENQRLHAEQAPNVKQLTVRGPHRPETQIHTPVDQLSLLSFEVQHKQFTLVARVGAALRHRDVGDRAAVGRKRGLYAPAVAVLDRRDRLAVRRVRGRDPPDLVLGRPGLLEDQTE